MDSESLPDQRERKRVGVDLNTPFQAWRTVYYEGYGTDDEVRQKAAKKYGVHLGQVQPHVRVVP